MNYQEHYLPAEHLPPGFVYPTTYKKLLLIWPAALEPWYLPDFKSLVRLNDGLRDRLQPYLLVPFAKRQDNDDIAAFDARRPGVVLVLHDFANIGWERPREFSSLVEWLHQVIDDWAEFE